MNLHLSLDEKFFDFVIDEIEVLNLNSENDFVVYVKSNYKVKYVKSKNISLISLESSDWFNFFKSEIYKYDRIFFHYLGPEVYDILKFIPRKIKVIWLFFGAEGFTLFNSNYFLQKETIKLSENSSRKKYGIFYPILYPFLLINRYFFNEKRRLYISKHLKRVDYFGHFLYSDYELIKNRSNCNFKYVEFSFNSVEQMLFGNELQKLGSSILIGNSATITNNHLDIFSLLKKINLNDVKIYCPLSYGDDQYADYVEQKGKENFGLQFNSLREFLPLDQYNKIMADCGIVIMNHNRSQSGDNMVIALHNGAKLFLSEKSPFFIKFKKLGLTVFSTQNDIKSILDITTPLSDEEKNKNKEIVKDYFGTVEHRKRLLNILYI